MDIEAIILIVSIIVLLLISAFFSSSETALTSSNLIKLKQEAKSNKNKINKAKIVYKMQNDFSRYLTTILVGNNIVNILASSLTTMFFIKIFGGPAVVYATIVMTVLVLVFGEVLPKTIAAKTPAKIALFVAKPLYIVGVFLKPITSLFQILQKFVDKIIKEDKTAENVTVTEKELLEIVQTIESEGVLDQDERELIESAIEFTDVKVRDVMLDKESVIFVNPSTSNEKALELFAKYRYSRIPVVNQRTQEVVGILYEREFLLNQINSKSTTIKTMMKEPFFVRKGAKIIDVLEDLQRNKGHMAIVIDTLKNKNYVGIITLEDILEVLVGEIYDEHDNLPQDVIEIGHHNYEVSAHCLLETLFDEYLDNAKLPRVRPYRVGQWITSLAKDKKLKVNDILTYDNLEIKILELDKQKVIRVAIEEMTPADSFFE